MIHYVVGGTFLTFLSSNIVNTIITGTLDTVYSGISFAKNGSNCNKIIEKVKKDLDHMDIKIKIELANTLIKKYTTPDIHDIPANDIAKIIINGIIELITKINSIIEWIDLETIKHSQKWLSGYRSIALEDKINELQNLVSILDGRILLLMNVKS